MCIDECVRRFVCRFVVNVCRCRCVDVCVTEERVCGGGGGVANSYN